MPKIKWDELEWKGQKELMWAMEDFIADEFLTNGLKAFNLKNRKIANGIYQRAKAKFKMTEDNEILLLGLFGQVNRIIRRMNEHSENDK